METSVFFHLNTMVGHTTNAQMVESRTPGLLIIMETHGVQQVWTVQEKCILEVGDTVKRGVLALDINSWDF